MSDTEHVAGICGITGCNEPSGLNWFCRKHYLVKEAAYALRDLNESRDPLLLILARDRITRLADYLNAEMVGE